MEARKAMIALERAARQSETEGKYAEAFAYRATIARIQARLDELLEKMLGKAA